MDDKIKKVEQHAETIKNAVEKSTYLNDTIVGMMEYKELAQQIIKRNHRIILSLVAAIVIFIGLWVWERNQYEYVTSYDLNGVYSLADSDGNVIASDLTPDQIADMANALLTETPEPLDVNG